MKTPTILIVFLLISFLLITSTGTTQQKIFAAEDTPTATEAGTASLAIPYLTDLLDKDFVDQQIGPFQQDGTWSISDEDGTPALCNEVIPDGWPDLVFGTSDWKDYSIEVTAKIKSWDAKTASSTGGGTLGIDVRIHQDPYAAYNCGIDGVSRYPYEGYIDFGNSKNNTYLGGVSLSMNVKKDTWFNYRCEISGNRLRTFFNGRVVADARDQKPSSRDQSGMGHIGASPATQVCFSHVTVRSLDSSPDALAAADEGLVTRTAQILLNLDKGAAVLGYAQKGSNVFILDTNSDKTQTLIRVDKTGVQGWIPSDVLGPIPTPTIKP